jgi:Skp family chaperone for outer membrane proteins
MRVVKTATLVAAIGYALGAAAAQAQTAPPAQPPATPPAAAQKPEQPKPPVPFPEGARIAYVNYDYVLQASNEGKALIAQLQEREKAITAGLAEKSKQLEEAQKKATAQANLMNEQARAQAARDIEKLGRDLEYAKQDAQSEFDEFRQKLLNEFGARMTPQLQTLAREKGLHMVFSAVPEVMAWAHEGIDLSGELVERLNSSARTK